MAVKMTIEKTRIDEKKKMVVPQVLSDIGFFLSHLLLEFKSHKTSHLKIHRLYLKIIKKETFREVVWCLHEIFQHFREESTGSSSVVRISVLET